MERLGTFQSATCVLGPGGLATVSQQKPFKSCLWVHYSLVGLMNTSPIFFQSRMFWGHIPQMEVLEVGAPDVGSKTFSFQEEAGSCSFPPRYVANQELFFMVRLFLSLSSSFLMNFISFTQWVGVTQLVSVFLSKGMFPYVAVDLVCPWE